MSSYRIGQPIKDSVADVIRERQALLKSRRNGYITDYYSSNAISLFNEKTPWVRLSSTVDIEDFSKAEYFGVSMGDQLAKRNVLQGTGEIDGGFDEYFRDGERIPGTFDRQELGLRPKPGITDVSTTSHGMFGALRTTEVTILCWTPFDLDIIDSLYMRPGYSLLLEMGHSHYHDKELHVQNDIIPVDFFEDYGQGNSQKLLDDLEKKREEYRGSYEAIYGVIKNFSWSLRTDGGYECKVKLVSKGEVLESLITTGLTDKVSVDKSSNSTALNSVVDAIDLYVDSLRDSTSSEWLVLPQNQYNAIVDKEDQGKYSQLKTVYSFRVLVDSSKNNSFSTCITLGLFNAIVNRLLIKEAIRDEQTDGVTYVNYTRIHTELDSNLFKTVSGHYSMNPRVCLLPKGGVTVGSAKFKLDRNPNLPKDVSPNGVNGILITTDLIRAAITNSLDQEENTVNILSVYRYIFSSIENATGNINNFNLHLDENTNTWHIVDRLFLNKQASPVELSIFGLDSFAKGVMLQSMLSPKVSSLLAISANVNQTPNSVLDSTAFSTLNRGLKDRIIPQREFPQVVNPELKVEEASRKKLIESKKLLEDYITSVYFNTQGSLRKYNIKDNISNVQSIYRDELNKAIQEQPNNGISFAIPFELTLTLDGIGGLVIGESFTVSADLLPLSYKRLLETEDVDGNSLYRVDTENSQVGFLITGLNQKVTETGWDTVVRCQMYVLHSNDVPDIPVIIDAIKETPELNIPEPEAGSTSDNFNKKALAGTGSTARPAHAMVAVPYGTVVKSPKTNEFEYKNGNGTRKGSLAPALLEVIFAAMDNFNLQASCTSGGQIPISDGGKKNIDRLSATKNHDYGYAADVQFYETIEDGSLKRLQYSSSSPDDLSVKLVQWMYDYIKDKGNDPSFGAGTGYMSGTSIHLGLTVGKDPQGSRRWGKGWKTANAPGWLNKIWLA